MQLQAAPVCRLSMAQLLGLVAIWAMAFAWPYWIGARPANSQPPWGRAFESAVGAVPVGVPLTLVVIVGRNVLSRLVVGRFVAVAVAFANLHSVFEGRTGVNFGPMAIVFFGLGAGMMGCGRVCYLHTFARHWWRGALWGAAALVCVAEYVFFIWLVQVL